LRCERGQTRDAAEAHLPFGANAQLPIIFITGHGDIPMPAQAMKGRAIEFLTKPFFDQELLDAIQLSLSQLGPAEFVRDGY
jgi:FixJ family two-component response regulator